MTKALMIIAPKNFRDEELFHTKQELEKKDVEVTVASPTDKAEGMLGKSYEPEADPYEEDPSEYDATIFVGGSGAETYFNDEKILETAKKAEKSCEVTAAICISPSILAQAGVLDGKKATVWSGDKYVNILKENGANYTGNDVEVDGKVITGNGPKAARKFGKTIARELGE